MLLIARQFGFALLFSSAVAMAQQQAAQPTSAAEAPNRDTSYIDAKGTAHVTRVVPVPQTISPEAQKSISRTEPDQGPPEPLEARRKGTDAYTARARVEYPRVCLGHPELPARQRGRQ